MLKEALKSLLDEKELSVLSSSFDVVGDIAIVKIAPELASKESVIARQILDGMKNVRTVLNQVSPVGGEFRTRELSYVAGERKFETIYKESGILFKVDVRSAYFSPRLSTERLRIRSLVADGEKIFNMFAGIGTFSLVIAKTKSCTVESVDKNADAIRLAFDSLRLNKKMKGVVHPVVADAKDFALEHEGEFDRILMPLPERSSEFLPYAIRSAKRDGNPVIHYYCHVAEEKFREPSWIAEHLHGIGVDRKFEMTCWKRVREVGPRLIQAVADMKLL
jgi:tRNA (guanine37-N1)-methyltransferase